jgi:hypothetical protein
MLDDSTRSLGDQPTADRSAGLPPSSDAAARGTGPATASTTIGRYTIVRIVGQGGMGTVYEAVQENPKRAVALKLIRPGYLSSQLLRRFEQESQVLGPAPPFTAFCTLPPENHRGAEGTEGAQRSQ